MINIKYDEKDIKRFWKLTKRENKKNDECWDWLAHKNHHGYGVFGVKDKTVLAHRFIFFVFNGSFDEKLLVCHTCDNRSCVNPKHLFLGTNIDNMRNMIERNRSLRGEKAPGSKLKEFQVIEIRERYANGETGASLAKEFNVDKSTITLIASGNSWGWANGPITLRGRGRKLSHKDYLDIQNIYKTGKYFMREIAAIYNVGYSTINRIIHLEIIK
jgi:DNA-binding MarR family transcriptional regulator